MESHLDLGVTLDQELTFTPHILVASRVVDNILAHGACGPEFEPRMIRIPHNFD